MYEDADETFLEVNSYEFPKVDNREISSKMRKYLQIIPNFEHTMVDHNYLEENSIDQASVIMDQKMLKLGKLDPEDSLWSFNDKTNKYFKLRLESKNSGKKIDLNLTFKIKYDN
jgi:hypothetical protein